VSALEPFEATLAGATLTLESDAERRHVTARVRFGPFARASSVPDSILSGLRRWLDAYLGRER
jgi:hypothetical protein